MYFWTIEFLYEFHGIGRGTRKKVFAKFYENSFRIDWEIGKNMCYTTG